MAPEILEGVQYGTKADMWSLGVIVYILLGGYPPFVESNQRELFRKIRKGSFEFHEEYWGCVSKDAKQLISALLTVNPSQRLSADAALKNVWIMGDDSVLEGKDLGKNLKELKKFNAKRKFKASVHAVRFGPLFPLFSFHFMRLCSDFYLLLLNFFNIDLGNFGKQVGITGTELSR